MVAAKRGSVVAPQARRLPETSSSGVRVAEIFNTSQLRLEASAYGVEMRRAVAAVRGSPFDAIALLGDSGLCTEAHNAFRFRRIYVSSSHGVPFLSSSNIIEIRPRPEHFLSRLLTKHLDDLLVKKWDVLISCSGTVGNVCLAGDGIAGMALSQHVIRMRASDANTSGFAAAFLRSRFGRPQLSQAAYGSVVQHIEPEHLERVVVPGIPPIRRGAIGAEMCKASELRDRANALLDEADAGLCEMVGLPSIHAMTRKDRTRPRVHLKNLASRFEARFHDPAATALIQKLLKRPLSSVALGSASVADVRAVTKFRKRLYVRTGGMPLLPSKQLFQVDPIEVKGLARGAHLKDLPEIQLSENMILVTCSGTVGRVHIVPKYMAAWAASQDALRIVAAPAMHPGFLYAWLASPYGQLLVNRYAYGSVIVHIDREMLAAVPVPVLPNRQMQDVGDKVLAANSLRHEAWEREMKAIRDLERLIEPQT